MRSIALFPALLSGIALATTLSTSNASAQTQKTRSTSSATNIKRSLNARKSAVELSINTLSDYKRFKQALSPLVVAAYKARVRKTDSGFIDAVLRPIYSNLIIRRINTDKRFRQQASLTGATVKLDILKTGEVLLYQRVSFTPKKVFSCGDKTRSANLLCVKSTKEFASIESKYDKNQYRTLEKQVKIFKAKYKTNRKLASRLRGWNLQKMTTLRAAYTGLAAMPVVRERGSKFIPAAVFAYSTPRDGAGSTSGQTGGQSPGTSPGPNIRVPGGGDVMPGAGNLRSSTEQINTGWKAFDPQKLKTFNHQVLLASNETTERLLKPHKPLAWAVSNEGERTQYELLNGFTNNHRASIGDRWNIVCVDYNPFWPGCTQYWFGFELRYGYLYGIRAGFNVTTTARLTNSRNRSGAMTVNMNTGNKNAAVFRGSNLRNQDIFGGKELLARLCQQNSCSFALLGDMPGPDPLSTRFTRWTVPEVDFLKKLPTCNQMRRRYGSGLQCSALDSIRNGQYNWPNASSTVNLARMVAPIDLFGGQLQYGVAGAEANPYLALNTRGKGYRQHWRKANGSNRRVSSRTSNLSFNFNQAGNSENPLVTGKNNEYDFNFSITPGIALKGQVVGYGLGPWYIDIDALAINSPTFTLYRHHGTWNGAWTGVPAR